MRHSSFYLDPNSRSPRAIFAWFCLIFAWFSFCSTQSQASEQKKVAAPTQQLLDPHRMEWGAIGGPAFNIDTGLEIGGFVHVAQFRPGFAPYLWRFLMSFKFAVRGTPEGIEFPIHDYIFRVDIPGLFNNRLRLQLRAGFKTLISQYYGLGNQSEGTRIWKQFDKQNQKRQYTQALRYYQYRHTSPSLRANIRYKLAPQWSFFISGSLTYHGIKVLPNSKLEEDIQESRKVYAQNPLRTTLWGTSNHNLLQIQTGLLWDKRNNEFTPSRGWLHSISLRFSPGELLGMRYSFVGLNLSLRVYLPIWKDILVLAIRGVADSLWGEVPFYLLTATGGLFAVDLFGGGNSIRGVRSARLYGNNKIFGNFELRAKFIQMILMKTYFSIGFVAFFDAGRVWMAGPASSLDDDGPILHIGAGGGLRLQWGKSLIIRFDLAWSPDADPIGFYFNLGHLF